MKRAWKALAAVVCQNTIEIDPAAVWPSLRSMSHWRSVVVLFLNDVPLKKVRAISKPLLKKSVRVLDTVMLRSLNPR